jgi:hypothetical protein
LPYPRGEGGPLAVDEVPFGITKELFKEALKSFFIL